MAKRCFMIPKQKNKCLNLIVWCIVAYIGIAYTFMGFYMPLLGDDLGFYHSFASQNDCWYAYPRSMYRQWIWNNARMADMLIPLGLYVMPQWLCAVTYGIMTVLLYYVIIRLCGKVKNSGYLRNILIISLISFTFRWDALWMECCTTYNYVWGAVFSLAALGLILKHKARPNAWYWWISVPFCFIASAMHEASGLPLAIGLMLYFIVTGAFKRFSTAEKVMSLFFIAGGIFTMTSPAAYSRVGNMLQPESPIDMLLFSAGYVILMVFFICWIAYKNRPLFYEMIRSPWIIFVSGALISTAFMLLSQYGGRTGWYAQIFALIAIFQILNRLNICAPSKIAIPVTVLLGAAIIFHYSELMIWQKRLGTEARIAISLYRQSPDGIIYMDYTNEPELPWYLLRKTHGVPDEDDTYYRYRMSKHYGHNKPLVILPENCRNVDWQKYTGIMKFGERFISDKPLEPSYTDQIVDIFPRIMTRINGQEYIETVFKIHNNKLYLYSPVDRDPGEK